MLTKTDSPKNTDWFESWFDSPYYHILYSHRNETEAKDFIHHLGELLDWKKGQTALDLACGKGRHSIMLSKEGLEVTGVDLSPQSIAAAQKMAHSTLHFDQHDMRKTYRKNAFDYVFNLFTSFGYFEDRAENGAVVRAATENLKPNGKLIIDFLNVLPILKQLPVQQTISKGEYTFEILKKEENGSILKEIRFTDPQTKENHLFTERVQAFQLEDFEEFFSQSGLQLKATYGDYQLSPFGPETSERLIVVGEISH